MPTTRVCQIMDFNKQGSDKKASKPLMEKRRRARINHSLAQLKSLVIDPNTTERSRQAKLEKADILELTVRHLHEIKRRQKAVESLNSGNPKKKFELGYSECLREVELFLTNIMDPQLVGIDQDLQRRLKEHLGRRLQEFYDQEPHPQSPSKPESSSTSSLSVKPDSTADSSSPSPPPLSPCGVESYPTLYPDDTKPKQKHEESASRSVYSPNETLKRFGSPPAQLVPQRDSITPSSFSESEGFTYNRWLDKSNKPPSPPLCKTEYPQPRDLSKSKSQQLDKQQETFTKQSRVEDLCSRITLAPRRLPNGDWALVLPGNVTLSDIERQSPSSAFRLVWPSSSSSEMDKTRHVVSPLSSSVSDLSCEEYGVQEPEMSVKMEQDNVGNEDPQFVWRPW